MPDLEDRRDEKNQPFELFSFSAPYNNKFAVFPSKIKIYACDSSFLSCIRFSGISSHVYYAVHIIGNSSVKWIDVQ